jgi:hypothetical protein
MIKVDWNKTIGKWFPWTAGTALKDNESKNKKSGQTE